MMDKIYEDFTTKLLPKISEGMVITKDYFTDLFGRYVKFLIVRDAMDAVFCLGALIALVFGAKWLIRKSKEDKYFFENLMPIFAVVFGCVAVVFFFFGLFSALENLIKDVYLPEMRIYEEISTQIHP